MKVFNMFNWIGSVPVLCINDRDKYTFTFLTQRLIEPLLPPPKKLRTGNVFSRVCLPVDLSIGGGGTVQGPGPSSPSYRVLAPAPRHVQTCSLGPDCTGTAPSSRHVQTYSIRSTYDQQATSWHLTRMLVVHDIFRLKPHFWNNPNNLRKFHCFWNQKSRGRVRGVSAHSFTRAGNTWSLGNISS